MAQKYLLDRERVVRFVPWAKLRKNQDETEVYGPLATAFGLRLNEEYLSANWCEYFEGTDRQCLRCAVEQFKKDPTLKIGGKARFAVALVGSLKDAAASRSRAIRIVHEPETENGAHAAIRNWPRDDDEFLDFVAQEVWSECWSQDEISTLEECTCELSARANA